MPFLETERATLEKFFPALDARLSEIPFAERERPGNKMIALYRQSKGPSLLIPEKLGGLGASALEAVRIHRALGSRAPSLAVAATMHNFSVATLVEYSFYGDETMSLLRDISEQQLFVASGFAEGRAGVSILQPVMQAERVAGGYAITGSKKPCSLSRSMDLLTASVAVPNDDGAGHRRAVAIIPADSAGIDRKPFWKNWVLTGAESDELILTGVIIPESSLFFPQIDAGIDAVEAGGFMWFELLVSASYLGMASALAESVFAAERGGAAERASLGIELEGAMAMLEGLAYSMIRENRGPDTLARSLFCRFAVQRAVERAVMLATELVGGMAYISSSDISYLLAATRALAYHPPSRLSISASLAGYMAGKSLDIV